MACNVNDQNEQDKKDDDSKNIKESQWKFLLGPDFTYKLAKRWNLHYGIDLLYEKENANVETTRTVNSGSLNGPTKITQKTTSEEKSTAFGGGFFFAIQFLINKNLSLATESSIHYLVANSTQTSETTITPTSSFSSNSDTDNKTDSQTLDINLPVSLFMIFSF